MKRISIIAFILVAYFAFLLQPAKAMVIYSHDDGTAETDFAAGATDTNIWLNVFQTVLDGEIVKSIDIAFGGPLNGLTPPVNGTAMTAYLWTDPNNNGDPLDALLVASVAGTVQLIHTDTFINFALPVPVILAPGDFFFAGFQSPGFGMGLDTDSSAVQSWIFSNNDANPLDPTNLAGIVFGGTVDSFGLPGNALIRANADPIPEPATIALLGIGLVGLAGGALRRTRKKNLEQKG